MAAKAVRDIPEVVTIPHEGTGSMEDSGAGETII